MTQLEFLTPVLLLISWTIIMWLWMYATRIPAMQKAKVNPDDYRHPGTSGDMLPANVRSIADNYNHLHEQPTLFYALMLFTAMTGGGTTLMNGLAFGYVGVRIVHSLVQSFSPRVALRFLVFSIGSIILMVMTVLQLLRVFL